MPEVRITQPLKKPIRQSIDANSNNPLISELAPNKNNQDKNDNMEYVNKCNYSFNFNSKFIVKLNVLSRENMIQNALELQGFKLTLINTRPKARSQLSFTLDDNNAYLVGGLLDERLNDIWYCEIRGN